MNSGVMEKISLVWTLWGVINLTNHVFITQDVGLQIIWLLLSVASAGLWGYWSHES